MAAQMGGARNPAEDMRKATEQGVEQAKKGLENFSEAAQEQTRVAAESAADLGQKVLTFTERNISATLQFGQRVMKAKDLSEVTRLQSEYLSAQMQALTDQAREMTELASRAMMGTAGKRSTPTQLGRIFARRAATPPPRVPSEPSVINDA